MHVPFPFHQSPVVIDLTASATPDDHRPGQQQFVVLPNLEKNPQLSSGSNVLKTPPTAQEIGLPGFKVPEKFWNKKARTPKHKPYVGRGGERPPNKTTYKPSLRHVSEPPTKETESFYWLRPEHIRDMNGNCPGSSNYDRRTLYIPESAWASFSPTQRQYWRLKQQNFDLVLFFKV